ncbi:hypothetical protein [Flagellimonas allohymeniacidonis]|uniref:Uncharacterized protein n=1 Tax=Flagellimonas allohymeniacidonis TaxID=2517819 RepID=A0A4V2HSY7_9FLAO|nr:hypothetical protein [Allomuricauda hymeniacidonis]TAI49560.1 hypothetical protein EW142_07110 [Allomuricauda hymeniacidonis]
MIVALAAFQGLLEQSWKSDVIAGATWTWFWTRVSKRYGQRTAVVTNPRRSVFAKSEDDKQLFGFIPTKWVQTS